jgi:hypothetical protein
MYIKGHTDTTGLFSTLGVLSTPSLTYRGVPVISSSNLASTVDGLGTYYISSGPANIASTIAGLASLPSGYVSTLGLISTIDRLGSTYVSTGSLVSTLSGNSNYVTRSNLISTVNGLGSGSYISTASLVSTVIGLSNTYITSNMRGSTVAGFAAAEQMSLVSTVKMLGQYYISSPALYSTVAGLGNLYISSAQLEEFVDTFATGVVQFLLTQMVKNLGSSNYISTSQLVSTVAGVTLDLSPYVQTLGYVSSTQLFSTVVGLGSLPAAYISTPSLISTVGGIQQAQKTSMVSTVAGLGSLYISSSAVTSTTIGLSNVFSSNLRSTVQGLGSAGYISTPQLVSTVNGLGSLPGTTAFISIASLVSTTTGYENSGLQAIVTNAGTFYISTSGITSTTTALLTDFSNALRSTAQGLGSSRYISTPQLVSTVQGLGSAGYISTASLVSTTAGYQNAGLQTIVNNAGQSYVSTSGLVSTTTGVQTTFSNALLSTARGLGSAGYISTPQLVSTVQGLGSAGYISTASLVSSYVAYANSGVQKVTDTSGTYYVSTSRLTSTTTGLLTAFSNALLSTARGLGSTGYISTSQLVSTFQGLGSAGYISPTSLISSYTGYIVYIQAQVASMVAGLVQYLPLTGLTSTSTGLQSNFSNAFFSTINGLGNVGFIRQTQLNALVNMFINGASETYQTNNLTAPQITYINNLPTYFTNDAQIAYFTRSNLVSTTTGITTGFSNTLVATFTNLNSAGYINETNLTSTVTSLCSNGILPAQFTSTSLGYSNAQSNALRSFIQNAGQIYVSTSGLASTTTGLQTSFSNSLRSTVDGLGSAGYISTPQLVSTVEGLGSAGYISSLSLTSTFTSLSNSFAKAAIILFENGLGATYISTPALVSTVIGLSNIYINTSNLISTVNNVGAFYISAPQLTSSITGIAVIQSNTTKQILTSTVAGLGQTYLSTLLFQSNITLTSLTAMNTMVGSIAYSNTVNLFSNGYIYYTSPFSLSATSNFYEGSNITMVQSPMFVFGSTIATTVRTIGYGSNYLYGDGSYMTVSSDHRLKEDIAPIDSATALEQVTSLRGVYYKKIGDTKPYIGCIAQEVEAVFPQVITTHPSVEPKDLKSIKYEFLLAPLLESVKELIDTHSTLKYFVEKKYGNIQ